MSLGILFSYIVGSVVRWDVLAWLCSAMAFFLIVVMFGMPESPVWLRNKKRFHEAEKARKWLKLPADPIRSVITDKNISVSLGNSPAEKEVRAPKLREVIFTRPLFMPLIIGLMLLVLQQISGIDSIIFFTVEIFRESGEFDCIQHC